MTALFHNFGRTDADFQRRGAAAVLPLKRKTHSTDALVLQILGIRSDKNDKNNRQYDTDEDQIDKDKLSAQCPDHACATSK